MSTRRSLHWPLVLLLLPTLGCLQAPEAETEFEPDELEASVEELSSISCSEHTDTGYRRGSAFTITVVTVDGRPVEVETANAYYLMAQAASRAGVEIRILSGFRTMAQQEHLYACFNHCSSSCTSCNLAARPGYSNHQSGRALDLNTSRGAGVLSWLNAHAHEFGFSRTVSSEAWHWELTGRAPAGGPCRAAAHCDGASILVRADGGRGDCGAFGARCVDDDLGARCVFGLCPARGTDTFCMDDGRTLATCHDGAVGTGDCGAFGARCVDDSLGARCAFGACPARGERTICLDDHTLGSCRDGSITRGGDCSAFGARCADGPEGAHCAFYACPDNGDATVCLDQRTLGTCRDGRITTGDCGAFAAVCSTAGTDANSARCVSLFCVNDPSETPVEHDTCLPDGRIAHCDANGAPVRPRECSEGATCTTSTTDGVPTARCARATGVEEPTDPTIEEPTEPEPTDPEPYDPEPTDPTEEPTMGSRPRRSPTSSCAVASGSSGSASSAALALLLMGAALATRRRR